MFHSFECYKLQIFGLIDGNKNLPCTIRCNAHRRDCLNLLQKYAKIKKQSTKHDPHAPWFNTWWREGPIYNRDIIIRICNILAERRRIKMRIFKNGAKIQLTKRPFLSGIKVSGKLRIRKRLELPKKFGILGGKLELYLMCCFIMSDSKNFLICPTYSFTAVTFLHNL